MADSSRILLSAWRCGRAFACLAIVLAGSLAPADVRLPAIFSDHMVLQQDMPIRVWGFAEAGETVKVRIAGQEKSAQADVAGHWEVTLDKLASGAGLTLVAEGKNTITVEDVLVGEVWLCSGQSNMGMSLGASENADEDIATADYPEIRFFTLAPHGELDPQTEVDGKWVIISPQTARWFSAVGYYFGRDLYQSLHVPIGLIHSSVGGTPIENWLERSAIDEIPELRQSTAAKIEKMKAQPADAEKYPALRRAWEEQFGVVPPENKGLAQGWADPDFDDREWKTVAFPTNWAKAADVKSGGVFWLRKQVELPAKATGKQFPIVLDGMLNQYDTTYFNGQEIGHSGDKPPLFDRSGRRYDVPKELVKEGKNLIAIRVVAANPRDELLQRGAHGDYNLPADRHEVGNEWRVKIESLLPPLPARALEARPQPNDATFFKTPTVLYNAMIHPLIRYRIRGAIWYQGESNGSTPEFYYTLLTHLIEDWRRRFDEGDFPFYIVQLPNFGRPAADPNEKAGWAGIRAAQALAAAAVPNTGLAVTIDVGETDAIHPIHKAEVGRRLALVALAKTYGQTIASSGPIYQSQSIEGKAIRIQLAHAEGLASRGGAPKWFAIAGADRHFIWADAQLDGESIIVSSPEVAEPVAVRYAWANNPEGANLFNSAGLPLAPFRTNDW